MPPRDASVNPMRAPRSLCLIAASAALLCLGGCGDRAAEADGNASGGATIYGQFTTKGPSPEAKFAALKRRAEAGEAKSQLGLARMYYHGDGTAKDHAKAAQWFLKAAEQGIALAQFKLGAMHEQGEGVLRDRAQAIAWWNKAAAQDNSAAREALQNLAAKPDHPG